jgi:hypothetical protein
MKNTLRENMRRFGTKNLTEAAASKSTESSVPKSVVGRSVTLWGTEAQTGDVGIDLGVTGVRRQRTAQVIITGIDLGDAATLAAYNAGKSVRAMEFLHTKGTTKFFDLSDGNVYFNRWLAGELARAYFSK